MFGRAIDAKGGMVAVASVAFVVLCGTAIAQQATEATTEVVRQEPSAWTLDCTGQYAENCQMSQSVTVRETGQRIMMVVVQKDESTSATHILLALPHRIYLPAGIDIAIDTHGPRTVSIETCDERACYASARVNGDFMTELRTGSSMDIIFRNLAQKPVTVPVSLEGFGGTYDRLP
jgi:invasion protein IalB